MHGDYFVERKLLIIAVVIYLLQILSTYEHPGDDDELMMAVVLIHRLVSTPMVNLKMTFMKMTFVSLTWCLHGIYFQGSSAKTDFEISCCGEPFSLS